MERKGWAAGRGSTVTTLPLEIQVRCFLHKAIAVIICPGINLVLRITDPQTTACLADPTMRHIFASVRLDSEIEVSEHEARLVLVCLRAYKQCLDRRFEHLSQQAAAAVAAAAWAACPTRMSSRCKMSCPLAFRRPSRGISLRDSRAAQLPMACTRQWTSTTQWRPATGSVLRFLPPWQQQRLMVRFDTCPWQAAASTTCAVQSTCLLCPIDLPVGC